MAITSGINLYHYKILLEKLLKKAHWNILPLYS